MGGEKLISTSIKFLMDNEEYEFNVRNNLHEYGLNMEVAVESWLVRTKNYTVQSLCDYITSKDPNVLCLPNLLNL